MEKEKLNSLINEINKIARLNILQYKIEKIVEEYDEFIEDFYFIEWLRLSTNNYTEKEELNNTDKNYIMKNVKDILASTT